jgi:hypothetical protein
MGIVDYLIFPFKIIFGMISELPRDIYRTIHRPDLGDIDVSCGQQYKPDNAKKTK